MSAEQRNPEQEHIFQAFLTSSFAGVVSLQGSAQDRGAWQVRMGLSEPLQRRSNSRLHSGRLDGQWREEKENAGYARGRESMKGERLERFWASLSGGSTFCADESQQEGILSHSHCQKEKEKMLLWSEHSKVDDNNGKGEDSHHTYRIHHESILRLTHDFVSRRDSSL